MSRRANNDMMRAADGAGHGGHGRVPGSGIGRDGLAYAVHGRSRRDPVRFAGRGLWPRLFVCRYFFWRVIVSDPVGLEGRRDQEGSLNTIEFALGPYSLRST